jgi:hypothetical protein
MIASLRCDALLPVFSAPPQNGAASAGAQTLSAVPLAALLGFIMGLRRCSVKLSDHLPKVTASAPLPVAAAPLQSAAASFVVNANHSVELLVLLLCRQLRQTDLGSTG